LDIVSHISPKKDIILYPGKHRERLEKELDFSLAPRVCDFSPEYAEDFLTA